MLNKIEALMAEVENLSANTAEELEALRIKYLSKKGAINDLMADFRNVPAEQKKEVGMRLNALKTRATERIAELKEAFETNDSGAAEMDLTRTAYPVELGTRHPLSIVKNEIIDIFARMGFALADGPEVEDDWHVFSSMNFAEDHPARDMQDTFFIEAHPDIILRTHTSSVQSRVMENAEPPSASSAPAAYIATRPSVIVHTASSIKWRRSMSIRMFRLQTSSRPSCSLLRRCLEKKPRFVYAPHTSPSPSLQPRWISVVTSVAVRVAPSVRVPVGLKFWAAVW